MAQGRTILSEDVSGLLPPLSTAEQGRNLFLVGFLVLFMELACIRWFAAYVIFLQFFTNVMLLACFLGMSCGCLAARARRDWLGYFPYLALGAVLLLERLVLADGQAPALPDPGFGALHAYRTRVTWHWQLLRSDEHPQQENTPICSLLIINLS